MPGQAVVVVGVLGRPRQPVVIGPGRHGPPCGVIQLSRRLKRGINEVPASRPGQATAPGVFRLGTLGLTACG